MGIQIRLTLALPIFVLILACSRNKPSKLKGPVSVISPATVPIDFGDAIVRPFVSYSYPTRLDKEFQTKQYLLTKTSMEEVYGKLSPPLLAAGWKQTGDLNWAIDFRRVAFESPDGRLLALSQSAGPAVALLDSSQGASSVISVSFRTPLKLVPKSPAQDRKSVAANPPELVKKLMQPFIRVMDSESRKSHNQDVLLTRYSVTGITFEDALKKLAEPLLAAGFKQSGDGTWAEDARVVGFKSATGQGYFLWEFAEVGTSSIQFEIQTPLHRLKSFRRSKTMRAHSP